jgi:AraC-like DNA-binding protein
MKALYEDITTRKGNDSFVAYTYTVPAFPFKWHYHPEYELTLILKGQGKRLVGDSHENFYAGDLVLLGPDLPHTWVSEANEQYASTAVVIQFSEAFVQPFYCLPECKKLREMLRLSSKGLFFSQPDATLQQAIQQLPLQSGIEKITSILSILGQLSQKAPQSLASPFFEALKGSENERRINLVCQYIQAHTNSDLSVRRVADQLHLSESAFCKFFKRVTGITFSDYVNDIRIGNACHLLMETDYPITQIAFDCGYESLSYFNRMFLKKKACTPRDFRKINTKEMQ